MAVSMPDGDPRRAREPKALFLTGLTPSNALDQIAVVGDRFLLRLPASARTDHLVAGPDLRELDRALIPAGSVRRCAVARTRLAHGAHAHTRFPAYFDENWVAGLLLYAGNVVWFLEKQDDLLVCEIRKADDETTYEFEIADAQGPTTHRFDSPED